MADIIRTMLRVTTALCAAASAAAQPALDFTVKHPGPSAAQGLPPGSSQISYFGERAAFSPDGSRIAFVGDYDLFEYDIASGLTRNLTSHLAHKTLLRVQYLADGNFLISGFHNLGKLQFATRDETRKVRETDTELFFLASKAGAPLVPLGVFLHEGYAQSRTTNRIAWAENEPHELQALTPDSKAASNIYVADVVVAADGLHAALANRKLVQSMDVVHRCNWEPQDFRQNDREIVAPCYLTNPASLRPVAAGEKPRNPFGGPAGPKEPPRLLGEQIVGVDIATGKVTTYYSKTDMYAEVEGLSPDGRWALIECGPVLGGPLDLCRFYFDKGPNQVMERVTFGQDYGPYKISNPVVSRDGKWAAAQFATLADDAGVGNGIALIKLPPPQP